MDQDEYDALPTENHWVGRCVRYWRNHYGLQQSDVARLVAEHLGVPWTQSVVANVEAGRRNTGLYELLALCIVFAVSLNDLLFPEPAAASIESPTPEKIKAPDQQRYALPHALGEALDEGWDAPMPELWSFDWPRLVRPFDVITARNEMLHDPDYRALLVQLYEEDKQAEAWDKLWFIVDSTYRHYFGGHSREPYTATDLVNAVESEMRDEQPDKKYETEHARRTLRHHARRRAGDLVTRKVMSDL